MKCKRWLALLLALLLLLCATACDSTSNHRDRDDDDDDAIIDTNPSDTEQPGEGLPIPPIFEQNGNGPLLYRVIDDDGDIVWLFGSIHVGEENYYPLPGYVTDALEHSDGLAVEFDIIAFESNYQAQLGAAALMMYLDGTTAKDHLSTEVYQQAVAAMRDLGIYNAAYELYKPVYWSSLIDDTLRNTGETDLGIDRHLIQMAYDLDLPVLDVESPDYQYSMLASYSDGLQELLLKTSVTRCNRVEEYNNEIRKLMDAWHQGNAKTLRSLLASTTDGLTQEEIMYMDEYNTKMLTDRDPIMTEFVTDALEDGEELFVCVGAAHVVGQNGVIEQLLAQGYTVELVK